MSAYPSVGVVLPTRGRLEHLRAAVQAALAQDYPGELRLAVVWDGDRPPDDLAADNRFQLLTNARTPGLAGARNTGASALETELIAFCDDDDVWLPGKLRAQVAALRDQPLAEMASCGIVVQYDGRLIPRLVGRNSVAYDELVRSRMVMVHSSTYLLRREALLDRIGLFDESIPQGQNEDWDLVLRAAHRNPIVFVDRPLVRVSWGDGSSLQHDWAARAEGMLWMLQHHPDILSTDAGAARAYGQLAFAYACVGRRSDSWLWSRRALRRNWHERRVPLALAVGAGLVSGDSLLRLLHRRGRGI